MKRIVLIFMVFIISTSAYTQVKETIDKMQNRIKSAKDDTSRINLQIELCIRYRLGNPDSSLFYGKLALESSRKIKYIPGQIRSLGFMSIVTGQQGNLPKSLELGFEALQLAEENHLENKATTSLLGIAQAYLILKDYPQALSYLYKFTSLFRNNSRYEGTEYMYLNFANAFEGMNQLDSARFSITKAIDEFRRINRQEPLVYETIGNIAMKSGNPDEALANYKKCLHIALQKNERRASAFAYNKIATFFKEVDQLDSAIYYAGKGLEESRIIGQKKSIFEAAALLSVLYESKDTKSSLNYLKLANTYRDSLFGTGNIQAVQLLVSQQEKRQKEIKAAQIAYHNQLKQYALVAGLALLLIVAFFLYRNSQKEKKAKNLLQEKNEEIQSTLSKLKSTQTQLIQSEKLASLGELTAGIAHEIQNPLNFVNNFSEMSVELAKELKDEVKKSEKDWELIEDLANDLTQNQEKINHHGKRASSIVKGMLEHSRTSTGVKEPTDINALADEYLRLAYHGLRAKDKDFNADFELITDGNLPKFEVIPQDMGRVLLNIINNAFWAVNERSKKGETGYEPKVTVSTQLIANSKVLIAIKDNGTGMTEEVKAKIFQPFFTTKPTGQGTGLGLSLAYDIITKGHGGTIEVESKEGEGTTFTIQIPTI